MAKKNNKQDKVEKEEKVQETQQEEKYVLADLVMNCSVEDTWIIYNLARKNLLEQFEQEMKDYGIKEISPTLTLKEFNEIINGEQ